MNDATEITVEVYLPPQFAPMPAAAILIAGLLAGCSSTPSIDTPSLTTSTPTVAVTSADLEGSWGLASYRNETDLVRTQKEAKAACNNPYTIQKGINGGVVMHLADKPQPQEVYLKVAQNGQVYIGPKGNPGIRQDRLIVSFGNGILVSQWVDPTVAERYGTMVFVRCGVQ